MTAIYVLRSPVSTGDASLPLAVRDALLRDVPNDGVRFGADLAFGWSYPGGPYASRPAPGAPANGAVVYDVAERANASVVLRSGQVVGYAGGGFDFSSLTDNSSYLSIPASVAADLYTPFSGASQRYLFCAYLKLPALADWNTDSVVAPFVHWSAAPFNTPSTDLFTLSQTSGATKGIILHRQTAGATAQSLSLVPAGGDYGSNAQLAVYRTATATGLRLRTANGTILATAAQGADNSGDFSALTGRLGVGSAFWRSPLSAQVNAAKWRLGRAFVENLARSGRDPITVLDDDYARVVARGVFS